MESLFLSQGNHLDNTSATISKVFCSWTSLYTCAVVGKVSQYHFRLLRAYGSIPTGAENALFSVAVTIQSSFILHPGIHRLISEYIDTKSEKGRMQEARKGREIAGTDNSIALLEGKDMSRTDRPPSQMTQTTGCSNNRRLSRGHHALSIAFSNSSYKSLSTRIGWWWIAGYVGHRILGRDCTSTVWTSISVRKQFPVTPTRSAFGRPRCASSRHSSMSTACTFGTWPSCATTSASAIARDAYRAIRRGLICIVRIHTSSCFTRLSLRSAFRISLTTS